MTFNLDAVIQSLPYFAQGVSNTLMLTIGGIVFSTLIGIALALVRISKNRFLNFLIQVYVEVFRNTPLIAQIFFLYFALPQLGIKISAFLCGLVALVLHFSAYNLEVFRAGLEAVPRGLGEAGEALGFTKAQRNRLIFIPIAFRLAFASIVNNYVSLLKNTALVSIIGVVEVTFVAQDVIADHFTFLEMYSVLMVIYLVLVFGMTWALRRIEKRIALHG